MEAAGLARVWMDWVLRNRGGAQQAAALVHPAAPNDIRRMATILILRETGSTPQELVLWVSKLVEIAEETRKPVWAYDTAMLLMEYAAHCPLAAGQALAASQAAVLLRTAGHPDLAERADQMALASGEEWLQEGVAQRAGRGVQPLAGIGREHAGADDRVLRRAGRRASGGGRPAGRSERAAPQRGQGRPVLLGGLHRAAWAGVARQRPGHARPRHPDRP